MVSKYFVFRKNLRDLDRFNEHIFYKVLKIMISIVSVKKEMMVYTIAFNQMCY